MAYYEEYLDVIANELQAGHRQWRRGDKLLGAFGYTRHRPTAIDLISQQLKAKGMFTVPKIDTSMPLDRGITFYLKGAKVEDVPPPADQTKANGPVETIVLASEHEEDDGEASASVTIPTEPPTANEEAPEALTLIVGNLACSENRPLQITPSETVAKALTEMALKDYSQLVVTSGRKSIRGIVSYKSIAQAFLHGTPKTVNDCLDKSAPIVEKDEPLLKVVDRFSQFDVVLITHKDKSLAGIVTPADIAAEFGGLARRFFSSGRSKSSYAGWLEKGSTSKRPWRPRHSLLPDKILLIPSRT